MPASLRGPDRADLIVGAVVFGVMAADFWIWAEGYAQPRFMRVVAIVFAAFGTALLIAGVARPRSFIARVYLRLVEDPKPLPPHTSVSRMAQVGVGVILLALGAVVAYFFGRAALAAWPAGDPATGVSAIVVGGSALLLAGTMGMRLVTGRGARTGGLLSARGYRMLGVGVALVAAWLVTLSVRERAWGDGLVPLVGGLVIARMCFHAARLRSR